MRTLAIITALILVVSIIFNFALNNHLAETQLLQEITPLNDSNSSNQPNYLKPNFLLASETDTPANSNTQSTSDKIAEADLLVQRSMASASWWMVFSNIILVFTTFWLLMYNAETLRLANQTQRSAMKTELLQHPPKITINQVTLTLEAGKEIEGQCFIFNEGGHRALIAKHQSKFIRSQILIYWTDKNLPQKHIIGKHEPEIYNRVCSFTECSNTKESWINPGDAVPWKFSSKTPLSIDILNKINEGFYSLYVIGLIGYADDNSQGDRNHRTLFCHKYCKSIDRYIPVEDPYYEYKN